MYVALGPDMRITGQLRKAAERAREVLLQSPKEMSHEFTLGELGVCLSLITNPLTGEGQCRLFLKGPLEINPNVP